jgi:AcrR family transcriptional regulator
LEKAGGEAVREGLRGRKRRETHLRIQDAARALFVARGYDGTTLEDIADAANLSRRTLFHYFKSKDDILMSMAGGMGEALVQGLDAQPPGKSPLATMMEAMKDIAEAQPHEELLIFDKVMRSSEAVLARKRANYILSEEVLFEAMQRRWPEPAMREELRLAANMVVSVVRLSLEQFNREEGKRSLADVMNDEFSLMRGMLLHIR